MKQTVFTFYLILLVSMASAQRSVLDNMYTIPELNRMRVQEGTYNTFGFVIKRNICPPCPKQGLCAPCPPETIEISTEKLLLEKHDLGEKDLIIFVDNAADFELNKKYRFLVQVLDVKTTAQILNNLKLIYSELAE